MSKEALKALNRKRGAVKAQLTRIKNFMNNPDEKDKTHLESKLDTLKSLRIKLSDIRDEYYEVVADDSDLEPLESEILDLEDDCEDIYIYIYISSSSHKVALCKSSRNCPNCSKRHNSLLCRNFERNVDSQRSPGSETLPNMEPRITTPTLNVNSECFQPKQTVESFENGGEFVGYSKGHSTMLLSTAVVYCQNNRGEVFPLRALLDSGSQSNLITREAALALGLKCERVNTSICGVNGTPQFIKNKVSTVASSKNRQFQKLMEFLVVPKITGLTPTNKLDISGIKIPEYIKLSDENFYSPGRIDLLLSNQIFFEILNSEKLKLADGKLILPDTVFGYVASGVMSHNYTKKSYCGLITNANELNNSIKRFWEIENCPDFEIPTMSREEKLCEEHFTSTYNREETGHFIVKMPLSRDPSCLGDSKQTALRRLNSLWRRLVQDPKILELYRNFIREYLEMGHMEEVVENEDSAIVYYLPHHGTLSLIISLYV
ncbi:integrase catalytic domain-containing protein [Trichonephila clavipes]|uniref:Integrase catalytic domain-containing protein n=1 Tax=Trichonephila clavipes TaxID=2585209 RepID=A0A8X6SJX5_TRICX|nr:integrase catalytic domain-containing protein [Trichonephila clavipes]